MAIDKTITMRPEGNLLTLACLQELVDEADLAGLPSDSVVKVRLTLSGQGVRSLEVVPASAGDR